MSDIFISYASADRHKARAIAARLEQEGWSVWWDRKIIPGQTFDRVLEEALDAARCVVVLWSKNSKKSDWVRNEATVGNRRGILVPAFIETVSLPLEFMRIQTGNLEGWEKQSMGNELEQFMDAVERVLTCGGLQQSPATETNLVDGQTEKSEDAHNRDQLNGGKNASLWKSGFRVIAFSMVAYLFFLLVFARIFPQTRLVEATKTIIILSIMTGAGLNFLWSLWRRKNRAK